MMTWPTGTAAIWLSVVLAMAMNPHAWAFISPQQQQPSTTLITPSRSVRLNAVKSKPPRNKRGADGGDDNENKQNPWTALKKIVYDGVDSVSLIADKQDDMSNNVQKGSISQGYDASVERSMPSSTLTNPPMSPAERILMREKFGSSGVRQGAGVTSVQQQQRQQREVQESRSSFDNFKSGVYGVVDFVTGPAPSKPSEKDKTIREETAVVELAVPSKKSFNEIREEEARARAEVRNEKIRAKKEDLYKIVDKLQESVDALPDTFDSAEEAVKDAISFSKTIPTKLEKTVQEIQAIPEKVEEQATATQRSLQKSVQKTQKVVQDVQDMPSKVSQSVQSTKKTIANTQESVQDAMTGVKVLVGLEKPKPKPPKRPPPPQKKPKEIALDLAGKAAGATGKLAWWTGKNAASLVFKGAKVAYVKGAETIGPVVEEAMKPQPQEQKQKQQQQQNATSSSKSKVPKPPSSPPPTPKSKDTAADVSSEQTNAKAIETPEQLTEKIAEAQALAKEVEEALQMAERALEISTLDKIPDKKNDKQ
ncbi:MAG: hypothetical protein SGILL_004259 [Bacillariaceae sp.]